MMQLTIPMERIKSSYCYKCNSNTVIAYDTKGRPINYVTRNDVSTDDILHNLNNVTLSYMKCGNCGARYMIDYSLGYARPVDAEYVRREFFAI